LRRAEFKNVLKKRGKKRKKTGIDLKHARTAGGGNERLMSQEAAESKGQ
jgi:hypothetical protein